jgi:hypothetical protein
MNNDRLLLPGCGILKMEVDFQKPAVRLMNHVSSASGLDDTVDCMLDSSLDVIGEANIIPNDWNNSATALVAEKITTKEQDE